MAKMRTSDGEFTYNKDEVDPDILRAFDEENPADALYRTEQAVRTERDKIQQQWIVALNFLAGEQWLEWSPRTRIIDRLSDMLDAKRPDIVRFVDNRLLPAYDNKHGRLCQVLHVPEVVPAPGRGDMFQRARLESDYLMALWWQLKMADMDVRIKGHLVALGPSWVYVGWNYDADLPECFVRSPFEVLVAPWGVKTVDDGDGVLETVAKSSEELRHKYPDVFKDWTEQDTKKELEEENNTVLASGDSFIMYQGRNRRITGMTAVRAYERKPCEKFEKGYKMVATRKRVLELKPLVDPDLWPSHFQFRYREMGDIMYPQGQTYPCISQQVMLNKSLSDAISDVHRRSHPRRLIRGSCSIDPESFDDLGSDIVWDDDEDNPELQPVSWDVPPETRTDRWRMIDLFRRSMDDALQLHDPSRGVPGGNVQSGVQLGSLQAQDDVHLTPLLRRIGETWGRVFERMLVLTSLHQKNPANLCGVDPQTASPLVVEDFKADKDRKSYIVRVRTVSNSPYDKLQNIKNTMDLAQYIPQALADLSPQDLRRNVTMGMDPSMFETNNEDRMEARRENVRLLKGDPAVKVEFWNNHQAHIEEHLGLFKMAGFADATVAIKEAAIFHAKAHQAELLRAMEGQQAMMQGPAQGGPQRAV